MADETRPIPTLGKSALQMLAADYNRQTQELALQILESMGLSPLNGWRVNLSEGVVTRETNEPSP